MQRRLAAILAADVAGYSRLMGVDETGTLEALQRQRAELIEPAITRHQGRIVKLIGDGLLAEFASVVEAVGCAAEVQRAIAERNATIKPERRLELRIGVHLGDVIVDDKDIYGDGVNVAARLEAMAEVGGICISRQAYDQVEGKLEIGFRELGPQVLKNIAKPVDVYAIDFSGRVAPKADAAPPLRQEVRYCRTPGGVRLAYATVGEGPPLVKTANWMNHLEYDWQSPAWRHVLAGLARNRTLIRYDARGNGMSDWEVAEISLDRWVSDLETVVDATGIERFPLLGISQGCAISIAYAARHPERVSHLILYGGFALGRTKRATSDAEREKYKAMTTLIRVGWGAEDPAFRQLFTSQFMPDATKEQADAFNELQRRTTSPECAARYYETVGEFDVRDLLPKVTAPTLVMHVRDDRVAPIEFGRQMASGIPGARFVALPGKNHLFMEHEPAEQRFFEELELFLGS
jgi:class 3 adenylate cyclase/pimeloyl-ACP methyl ester carboxylesterase